MSKSPLTSSRKPQSDHKCCGVVGQSIEEVQSQRRSRKHQPWVIRKIWILVTFGIMGYSGYAYINRLCLPMIKRTQNALGSQTTGIVLLVFFGLLYLLMIWSYFTVILTAPGYAREHVDRTERPPLTDFSASPHYSQGGAPPPSETVKSDSIERHKPSPSEKTSQTYEYLHPQDGEPGPSPPSFEHMRRTDSMSSHPVQANAGVFDTIVRPPLSTESQPSTNPFVAPVSQYPTTIPVAQSRLDTRKSKRLSKQAARNSRLDELNVFRKPPSAPVLQPVFRYCDMDEIIKPYRAHHCGTCGTCVLRYDHHCPWIGQCVGARNHKFFLNFCFATSIFTAYVFPSVLVFLLKSLKMWEEDGIEPHFIILLALSALFCIFTTALCASHVRLIAQGQTTVESMHIKAIQDKDEDTLARAFAWWECRAKGKRRKTFDEEWGSVNTEGNIWWRGSAYEEWQDVMGKSWLGWIFPIGGGLNDGLSYSINRRFDSDGRLRRRSEWPEDLR